MANFSITAFPHTLSKPQAPALDLACLSIRDMWCLSEMFDHLADTATSFLNQPRMADTRAEDYADELCNSFFYAMRDRIIEELRSRTPQDSREAYFQAQTIIGHLAQGEDFHELLQAVSSAIAVRRNFPAAY